MVRIYKKRGEIPMVHHKNEEITDLLNDLKDKKTRLEAFKELTQKGLPSTLTALITALKTMKAGEALSVASLLGEYGGRIISHMENLLKPSEKFSVYTSAIKALGSTKSEKAFEIIFPLLQTKEKWILSNEITFGETIDALVACGQGHLEEFISLLGSSDRLVRSGAVYACGKISRSTKQPQNTIGKLRNQINSIIIEDRSTKVRDMAILVMKYLDGEDDVKDSYLEAIAYSQQKMSEEDLYLKYEEKIEQTIALLKYSEYSVSKGEGIWEITKLDQENVVLSLRKVEASGEAYFNTGYEN